MVDNICCFSFHSVCLRQCIWIDGFNVFGFNEKTTLNIWCQNLIINFVAAGAAAALSQLYRNSAVRHVTWLFHLIHRWTRNPSHCASVLVFCVCLWFCTSEKNRNKNVMKIKRYCCFNLDMRADRCAMSFHTHDYAWLELCNATFDFILIFNWCVFFVSSKTEMK